MPCGNCLIGAILLAIRYRFRGRIVRLWRPNQPVPHFLYRVDRRTLHYRPVKDIMRGEWRYYFFWGRFEEAGAADLAAIERAEGLRGPMGGRRRARQAASGAGTGLAANQG